MAIHGKVESFTAQAAADLTGVQYHIMRLTASRSVNISSHAAAGFSVGAVGVLQNKPDSGQAATVGYFGVTKVVAGGAINTNVMITSNGSGRAAAATSGQLIIGRALSAAGANGEIIDALIMPVVRLSGAV